MRYIGVPEKSNLVWKELASILRDRTRLQTQQLKKFAICASKYDKNSQLKGHMNAHVCYSHVSFGQLYIDDCDKMNLVLYYSCY